MGATPFDAAPGKSIAPMGRSYGRMAALRVSTLVG